MAIEITKRPYSYCFSGNPVHYELYSALAAADATIYFEVKVLFRTIGGVYTETPVFPYAPVAGYAAVDIASILEGFLEYSLPPFDNDEKKVWEAEGHTGTFYIAFREITAANNNPAWDNSEADFAPFVIRGGVAMYKYQGNNFWINYMDADVPMGPRPFLTWQQSGRLAEYNERMYLAYLLVDDITGINVMARATYTDGSQETLVQPAVVAKNKVYYLPAGAAQWGFPVLKDLWYWEIWVQAFGSGNVISQTFRYDADNRNDYNDITLHYRNSLGGLDSVRVRGTVSDELDYDWQELQSILKPDYYDRHFFQPQKMFSNNREVKTRRGDIGHLEKEEQDRLRDAFVKREAWYEAAKKWTPVLLINKNIKLRTSEDNRWKLPIDFILAHDGDTSYTPDNVDLGAGVFTSNVCKAMLSPLTAEVDLSGSDAVATITGTEVDPQAASDRFRYRLLVGGVVMIPWTIYEYEDLPLVISDLPKDAVYTLETQAICLNAVHGKKVNLQINTAAPDPGGGGGGGGGSNNSFIFNHTAYNTAFAIEVDSVEKATGNVGATNATIFFLEGAVDAVVIIYLDFSPSNATLQSDGVSYPLAYIAGNAIVFENVTIVNGIILNIY